MAERLLSLSEAIFICIPVDDVVRKAIITHMKVPWDNVVSSQIMMCNKYTYDEDTYKYATALPLQLAINTVMSLRDEVLMKIRIDHDISMLEKIITGTIYD